MRRIQLALPTALGRWKPGASRKSSVFLRRIVGAMFMRVNSKCALYWAEYMGVPLRFPAGLIGA